MQVASKTVEFLGMLLALQILIPNGAGLGAIDIGIDFRDRQAAFLIGTQFLVRVQDFGVHEHARVVLDRIVLVRAFSVAMIVAAFFRLGVHVRLLKVDHQHALGHADLNRGEADAGRIVHRLEHVFDERLQIVIEIGDGGRDGFQPGVRHFKDFTDSHGAYLGADCAPNKRVFPIALIAGQTGRLALRACARVPSSR